MRAEIVSLAVMLALWPGLAWADAPSLPEVTQEIISQVLDPVVAAAVDHGPPLRIALREEPGLVKTHNLEDTVAGMFFDRGFEVFVLKPRDEPRDDALLLTWTVQEVGVAYPRHRRGFLGFRGRSTARSVRLGIRAELTDPGSGKWLWRGAPRARREDWVDAVDPIDPAHPLVGPAPSQAAALDDDGGSRSFWERGLVAGLLGGVLILYFSGVS